MNIKYNIKDHKYDQYSFYFWYRYAIYVLKENWLNPFELFMKGKKNGNR